ncbi:CAAX protease self-immunity [Sporobacter termitidis DSM 10068]|uniref:CAAX protease self-immunity n=1 Tax=Sporobacter termitidis DSM 10068 TaxID=1123282 RepID=A0A1M5UN41_9FIRM|nr:CPBP family intramembrane glutamic endopeptidase [Sporobacter termitidis]SHH64389.1 CAAX protease self-immunity [Sporobacter termitidis DSM 10068]
MWKDDEKAPIWEFLGWVLLISGVSEIIILMLEPYSIAFAKNGTLTAGYVIYAIIGILFTTPNPMIATYIVLRRHGKIHSVKDFCKLILHTSNIIKTVLITAAFCAAALCMALLYGTRTGSPWYLFIIALPVLIIGGGVEEIGWRGFLQPSLEKKFPFLIATLAVSAIWFTWHLPLWIAPSSNHYGDSLIGFAVTIIVWAFVEAAIYKATKSVFACVLYHTFMNAIGAVYDWNALFDTFPNKTGMIVYYCVALVAAIIIWVLADKNEKQKAGMEAGRRKII